MALAGRLHLATVVPVKFVQAGNILMGLLAGVDGAAGILLPGAALDGKTQGLTPRPSVASTFPQAAYPL